MKRRLSYLLPLLLLIVLAVGCAKSPDSTDTIVLPVGTFTGQFTRIHLNPYTRKLDTIYANLTLTMAAATGYAITGDTTKHAGSHGSYVVDGVNIAFSDQTLPTSTTSTAPPTKIHLNGVYSYVYTTTSMQITFSNDTLIYTYILAAK